MENVAIKPKMLYLDGETSSAIAFIEQMSNAFDIIQTSNSKKANNILSMYTPDVIMLNLCGENVEKGIDFIEATAAQFMPRKVVFGIIVGGINEEILAKADLHHSALVFTPITSKKSIINSIRDKIKNEGFGAELSSKKKNVYQNPSLV